MAELETLSCKLSAKELDDAVVTNNKKDFIELAIGNVGKWQLRIISMMSIVRLSIGWFQMGIIFLAPDQKFWCRKPEMFSNYTDSEWRNMSSPILEKTNCRIYDPSELFSKIGLNTINISTVPCQEFEFDKSTFKSTIISEWNLVCSQSHHVEISQSSMMLGVFIGTMLFGFIADRYGRKKPLFFCVGLQAITGFLLALLPWFYSFLVFRFLLAMASGGISITSFVLCMEIVGGKWMTIIPIIIMQIPFGLGTSILAGFSFLFRDWRKLQITLSAFSSLFLLFIWFIPESPRWLLVTGQKNEAIKILEGAARHNNLDETKVRIVLDKYAEELNQYEKKIAFSPMFKSKSLRIKTILLNLQGFATGLVFFAFSQYVGKVGGNTFITVTVSSLLVIPMTLPCIIAVRYFGRKLTIIFAELLTATSIATIIFVPKGIYLGDWPILILTGLCGIGMMIYAVTLSILTGELYPTTVRNKGIALMAVCIRIGSIVAPFVVSLEQTLPLITMASIVFCQAVFMYPLPETAGQPLTDTAEQAELLKVQFRIFKQKRGSDMNKNIYMNIPMKTN